MADDLVDRIRGLVAGAGSVNATARAIGLKQQTLDRIVRGEHAAPRVETLQKIAEFFDTTVDWLLTGKGRGPSTSSQNWNVIPQAEFDRWQKLIRSLGLPTETLGALASLPRATTNAAVNLPLHVSRDDAYRQQEGALRQRYRAAARHELLAWIELLEAWRDQFGKEKTRDVLTRYTPEIARGFRTPARATGLTERPATRKPRRGK